MKTITKAILLLLMVFSLLQVTYALEPFDTNNPLKGVTLYQFDSVADAINFISEWKSIEKITSKTKIFIHYDKESEKWNAFLINNLEEGNDFFMDDLRIMAGFGSGEGGKDILP